MESDFILSGNIRECDYGNDEWRNAKDYVSKSALTQIKESPAHYKYGEPFVETPEIIFGRAYHCYILQPEKFKKDYYVFDDSMIFDTLIANGAKSPRATKEYKEWKDEQFSMNDGKTFIDKQDFERMQAMKGKLLTHPYANVLISKGIPEKGLIGEIETKSGQIGIKLIPDLRNDNKRVCIELKTTIRASRDDFPKEAANYDYHIQAAFYSDMLELYYNDGRPVKFIFIAQEKRMPFAFNIFEADPQFISQGRYEYENLLSLYKYCLDRDHWPGYQVWCQNKYGIIDLKLPVWSIRDINWFDHLNHKQLNK